MDQRERAAAPYDLVADVRTLSSLAGCPTAARFAAVESRYSGSTIRSILMSVAPTSGGLAISRLAEASTIVEPRWHPSGDVLAAVADGQVVICHLTGAVERLSPPPGRSITSLSWLHGSALLVGTNTSSGRSWVYRLEPATRRWAPLLTLEGRCTGVDASPDGTRVAFVESEPGAPPDAAGSRLWLLDPDAGRLSPHLAAFGPIRSPRWAADGGRLAALVRAAGPTHWSGNWRIAIVSAGTDQLVGDSNLNYGRTLPGTACFAWRGGELLAVAPHRGAFRLWRVHPGPAVAISSADSHITDFAVAAQGTLALVETWPDRPPFLAVLDCTGRPIGELDPNHEAHQCIALPTVTRIEAASTDARPEAIVLQPQIASPSGSVIVDLHGGPHGSHPNPTVPSWMLWAALTSQGHTVLLPNPRGSTGYGLDYQQAVVGRWGGPDATDVLALLDAAVSCGERSSRPVGLTGWSYGAYLAAWLLTTTDRFTAGVLGGAITDLDRMTATTDIPSYCHHEFGAPGAMKRSPLNRVRPGMARMLLLHARDDSRCPVDQAMSFHAALVAAGNAAELVVYPSSEHVFTSPTLVADRINRTTAWFRPQLGE